jgi:hypothetical protein
MPMLIAPSRRGRPRVELLGDRCVPAGIAKVHDLGTTAAPSGITTFSLTLAAGVTAGDSILVEVATVQAVTTGAVTVADDAGNAYAKDADVANGAQRTLVFSAHHAHALPAGASLTITLAGGGIQFQTLASAAEFAGLGAAVPVDATHGGSGSSASPSSGPAATSHADDLLLGAISAQAGSLPGNPPPGPVAFTPGSGYTALASVTAGSGLLRLDLMPEYRVVSAAGSFVADGAFGDSRG